MIIMDFSQVVISTIMAELGNKKGVDLEKDLLRHMILNTIRSYKKKHGAEYGDMVIACDGQSYWRRKYFPNYKSQRKQMREDSGIDWQVIFDTMKEVREDLFNVFPYKVIHVNGAEADDVIATLCEWTQTNDLKETLFDSEPKPVLILSGDRDFVQLQKYKNIKQYSPVLKKYVVAERPPEEVVMEHILRGDKGDGVPNVLSDDDCIAAGRRQTPMSTKKVEEWINNPATMPTDDGFKNRFSRNQNLVDLSKIPDAIKDDIIQQFLDQPTKDRSQLINYFIKHRMKNMIELVGDF